MKQSHQFKVSESFLFSPGYSRVVTHWTYLKPTEWRQPDSFLKTTNCVQTCLKLTTSRWVTPPNPQRSNLRWCISSTDPDKAFAAAGEKTLPHNWIKLLGHMKGAVKNHTLVPVGGKNPARRCSDLRDCCCFSRQ